MISTAVTQLTQEHSQQTCEYHELTGRWRICQTLSDEDMVAPTNVAPHRCDMHTHTQSHDMHAVLKVFSVSHNTHAV
jgi:hypothetical protein